MRAIAIASIGLAACGGAVAPTASPSIFARARASEPDRVPVDPIAALMPDENGELSWVIPGALHFELGGPTIGAAGTGRPIEVGAIDQQGNLQRVAVRLDHARFSVWIDRAHMLSVLRRDQRIAVRGAHTIGSDIEVVLRTGATVRRLAHRERSTQIRYLGALQVEGWVPDAVLSDRGRARDGAGRISTGRKTMMVVPGAVIRAEPRWASSELAVMANGYFLDAIKELDDAWTEVSYEDGDVAVHGFVSKRDPPGRVHRWQDADSAPPIVPNATAPSGTCLYSRANGDAIGYVVGNRPVDLESGERGWWTITIDSPWGPLAFAAQGPSKAELVACAPPGSVPPSGPATAPAPTP
jgi:hypothetical protein